MKAYGDTAQSRSPVSEPRKKRKQEPDFTEPVAHLASLAVHDVGLRIGAFSREFIAEQPHVAAHIAFSPMETDHVQKAAAGISEGWAVAKAINSFAGIPGRLIQPLLAAIHNPDPEVGKRNLRTVKALQSLTPQEQTTLDQSVRAGYMGVPADQGGTESTGGEVIPGVPEFEAQRIRARVAKEMGTTLAEVDSHLWDAYYSQILGIPGTSLAEGEKHPLLSAALAGGSLALLAAPGVGELGVAGKILAVPRAAAVFGVAAPPISAGLRVGGQALEHLPGGHLIREAIDKPLGVAAFLGRELAAPGAWVTRKALDAAGVSPSDPLYSTVESLGGFIGGWIIGNIGARSFAGVRLARGAPEELVRGGGGPEISREIRQHLGGPLSGRVAKGFYEVFSKPIEKWMRTGPGKRLADAIVQVTDPSKIVGRIRSDISALEQRIEAEPSELGKVPLRRELTDLNRQLGLVGKDTTGLLVERFQNMPIEFAKAVSGAKTRAEVSLAFEEYVNRLDGPAQEAARTRVRAIDGELKQTDLLGARVTDLRAEKASLERRLSFTKAEPMFDVPKSSLIRRLRTASPKSALGQKLYTLYDPKVTFGVKPLPKVAHLFDDMPRNRFWNPNRADAPADSLSKNAEYIIRVGRGFGMKESVVRNFVQRIADTKLKGNEVYSSFVVDWGNAIRDTDAIAADVRNRYADQFGRAYYDRQYGHVAHEGPHGGVENVPTRGATTGPSPSVSSQFVDHIDGPQLADMREATSWIRSKARPFEEAKREAKQQQRPTPKGVRPALVTTYNGLKTLSAWSTAIFKPAALGAFGLRSPALWARIVGEEVIRARRMGDPVGFFRSHGEALTETTRGMLGEFARDNFDPIPSRTDWRTIDTGRWQTFDPQVEPPPQMVWDGLYDDLRHIATSPEAVELARRGLDGYIKWTQDNPSGRYWRSLFEENDQAFKEMSKNNLAWLDQVSGGNRALREAVVSSEWRLTDGAQVTERRLSHLGEDAIDEYARLQADETQYDDMLREAYTLGDQDVIRAIQDEQKTVRDRMKELDREGGVQARQAIRFDDSDKVTAELQAAWQRGEFKMPLSVRVGEQKPILDAVGKASLVRRTVQQKLYNTISWVGKSDIKRVRGGLFKSIYDRENARLRSLGHDPEFADSHAEMYAAKQTTDIMYDLTARNSAHHFFRNVFWFSPAWQEVLTTWTIKIPARYYWPVGAAYLASEAGLMLNLAKDLGIVHKNQNGDWQTNIPGANRFFDLFANTAVHEIVSFQPSHLSFVTGGIGPGLSTPYSILVGDLAKKYGGVFGKLSDALQTFGPESTVAPAAVNDIFHFINPDKVPPWEFFSRDYQQFVVNEAFTAAMQDASVQLGPFPTAPANAQKDPKAAERYRNAWDQHLEDLKALATKILRAHYAFRFLGHSVFPTTFTISSAERERAGQFFSKNVLGGKSIAASGLTQDQLDKMSAFTAQFPDSAPYLVWQSMREPATRKLWFTPSAEDPLWAQVYRGERQALTPDQWGEKKSYIEFLQMNAYKRDRILAEAAGVSIDQLRSAKGQTASRIASTLLRNGFQKGNAMTNYTRDFRFYDQQHPEFAGAQLQHQQDLLRVYKQEGLTFPLWSFETQTFGDLNELLKEASKYLLLDGHTTHDFRSIKGQVARKFADLATFPGPKTDISRATDWYQKNVMTPYWDEVQPLYDKARRASEAGLTDVASVTYDKIRDVNNRLMREAASHGGVKFPSPEQVMYGNLSPEDQTTARLKWLSQPTTWLSDFQRSTVFKASREKPALKVFIDPSIQAEPSAAKYRSDYEAQLQNITKRSVDFWNRKAGAQVLQLVDNRQDADVVVRGSQNVPRGDIGLYSPGVEQGDRSVIRLKSLQSLWLAEHELGHALGLEHTPGTLMAHDIGENHNVNPNEIKALREQFGIKPAPPSKNWDSFVKEQTRIDGLFQKATKDLSPSSNDYQRLQKIRDDYLNNTAQKMGVQKMWSLSNAAPYVRVLQFDPVARSSLRFRQAAQGAEYVQNRIDTAPSGSKTSTKIALWKWYGSIIEDLTNPQSQNYSPEFAGVMKDLSYALAPSGKTRRSGRLLTLALFFGEFNPSFIPQEALTGG